MPVSRCSPRRSIEPVGVEHDRAAGLERHRLLLVAGNGSTPSGTERAPSRNCGVPSARERQRRRMAGVDPRQLPRRPGRRPRARASPCARATGSASTKRFSALGDLRRAVALERVGADRVAQRAERRRRRQALARHVAHDEQHAPAGQRDRVVPVAADLGLRRRRQVARAERDARQRRQRLRQQAALQRLGDAVLAAERARVVDRQRDAVGRQAQQVDVVGAQPPRRAHADLDDADDLVACATRAARRASTRCRRRARRVGELGRGRIVHEHRLAVGQHAPGDAGVGAHAVGPRRTSTAVVGRQQRQAAVVLHEQQRRRRRRP